mmetsp:Transcript_73271/g.218656  ORF Transcript_73271/g.218656 Transcript_73271/m.218656 type:complete len:232 (-) Transcript_73271:1109-1804(-)
MSLLQTRSVPRPVLEATGSRPRVFGAGGDVGRVSRRARARVPEALGEPAPETPTMGVTAPGPCASCWRSSEGSRALQAGMEARLKLLLPRPLSSTGLLGSCRESAPVPSPLFSMSSQLRRPRVAGGWDLAVSLAGLRPINPGSWGTGGVETRSTPSASQGWPRASSTVARSPTSGTSSVRMKSQDIGDMWEGHSSSCNGQQSWISVRSREVFTLIAWWGSVALMPVAPGPR